MINAYIINVASYPAVFDNEERSSMYTANNDGDNIPTCRTLLALYRALYEINYIYFFQHWNLILDIRMIKIK